MAVFQLQSNNPALSFIIGKRPPDRSPILNDTTIAPPLLAANIPTVDSGPLPTSGVDRIQGGKPIAHPESGQASQDGNGQHHGGGNDSKNADVSPKVSDRKDGDSGDGEDETAPGNVGQDHKTTQRHRKSKSAGQANRTGGGVASTGCANLAVKGGSVRSDGRWFGWYTRQTNGSDVVGEYNVLLAGASYAGLAAKNRRHRRRGTDQEATSAPGYVDASQYCSSYGLLDCLRCVFESALRGAPHALDTPTLAGPAVPTFHISPIEVTPAGPTEPSPAGPTQPTQSTKNGEYAWAQTVPAVHRFWIGTLHVGAHARLIRRFARLLGFHVRLSNALSPNPNLPAPARTVCRDLELGLRIGGGNTPDGKVFSPDDLPSTVNKGQTATCVKSKNADVQSETPDGKVFKPDAIAVNASGIKSQPIRSWGIPKDPGTAEDGWEYVTAELWAEKKTLKDLLAFVYVLGMMMVLCAERADSLDSGMFEYGVRLLAYLRAPYSVVRQFTTRALRRETVFAANRAALERILLKPAGPFLSVRLGYGNSAMQRRAFILNQLLPPQPRKKGSVPRFERDIVDCGCGNGDYAIPFGKLMAAANSDAATDVVRAKCGVVRYHAIDVDPGALDSLRERISKTFVDGELIGPSPIQIYESMDAYYRESKNSNADVDVIVTEMIEHLQPSEAEAFLVLALKRLPFRRMIVTTPDADFNKYLDMATTLRHADHKCEMTKVEFQTFVRRCVARASPDIVGCHVSFHAIGDQLNDDSITQCVIIQRLE
jgi:hypothetical protein